MFRIEACCPGGAKSAGGPDPRLKTQAGLACAYILPCGITLFIQYR